MRPAIGDVEAALRVACHRRWSVKYLWAKRLARLDEAKAKSTAIEKLVENLQDHHWFERFVARHVLYHRGGEAVAPLLALGQSQQPKLVALADWLLEGIGRETTQRLADTPGVCDTCFAHHQPQQIVWPNQKEITYHGCRICGQSRNFTHWPNGVIAVLDQQMRPKKQTENAQLRVNWLKHRAYFDFDRVEIIQASDEQVERFAMQLGNDPSREHKAARKQIACTIFSTCHLSENSLRILQATFGQIERLK